MRKIVVWNLVHRDMLYAHYAECMGLRNPLTIGIQNPSFTDKESAIHYLESGIHFMKCSFDSQNKFGEGVEF